jgi:hypothetical protein
MMLINLVYQEIDRRTMSRNLIVYKVNYVNRNEDYNIQKGRFVRTKRIIMPLSKYDNSGSRYRNHNWVEKEFSKQMMGREDAYWNSKYTIMRIRKAK